MKCGVKMNTNIEELTLLLLYLIKWVTCFIPAPQKVFPHLQAAPS